MIKLFACKRVLFTAVESETGQDEHDDEDNEEENGHKCEDDDADSMIGSASTAETRDIQ